MNPKEQKKLDDAIRTIREIMRCESVQFKESVLKRIVNDEIANLREIVDPTAASTADVNETFSAGAGATVAKDYSHKAIITIDGADYYIGLYAI